jgi:hypothetical protein
MTLVNAYRVSTAMNGNVTIDLNLVNNSSAQLQAPEPLRARFILNLLRTSAKAYWSPSCQTLRTARQPVGTGELAFDVNAWLAEHPAIRKRIYWATPDPDATGGYYNDWSAAMKSSLREAVRTLFEGGSLGIPDPPPLADEKCATYLPTHTCLSKEVAWKIFIGHIAHCIYVDASHLVPWSLTTLHGPQLNALFAGQSLFHWYPSHQVYMVFQGHGHVTPGDPSRVFTFLAAEGILGSSRLKTISRLFDWCRRNLQHAGGQLSVEDCEAYWQYRGFPPVRRIIEGTPDPIDPSLTGHYSGGCHSTVGFLKAVLRTVNIPVGYLYCAGHGQAWFMKENLYLEHGDDIYISDFLRNELNEPAIPSSEFLIDQAAYESWFDPNLDETTKRRNIKRQWKLLAVKYLTLGLLRLHCEDLAAGNDPEHSKVFDELKDQFTLSELQAINLWPKLDARLIAVGGCAALPPKL